MMKKNLDGSVEFYKSSTITFWEKLFCSLFVIPIFSLFGAAFFILSESLTNKIVIITFTALLIFYFLFKGLTNKEQALFTLSISHFQAKKISFMWQNVSNVYFKEVISGCTQKRNILFYLNNRTQLKSFEISSLTEEDRELLLQEIEKHHMIEKEILTEPETLEEIVVYSEPPAYTSFGLKLMNEIGEEILPIERHILLLIAILFLSIIADFFE